MKKLSEDVLRRVNEGFEEISEDTGYGEIVIAFNGEDSPVTVITTKKAHIHTTEQKRPVKQHFVRQG